MTTEAPQDETAPEASVAEVLAAPDPLPAGEQDVPEAAGPGLDENGYLLETPAGFTTSGTTDRPDLQDTTAPVDDTPEPEVGNPDQNELDILLEPEDLDAPLVLTTGDRVTVKRLRLIETLALMKVITGSTADIIANTRFSADMDPEEFTGIVIGAVLFSVPEQPLETVAFIRTMVDPLHLIEKPKTKQEQESNAQMVDALNESLANPEIEDTFLILERVIKVEMPHMLALGKRLSTLLEVRRRSQIAKGQTSPDDAK